MLDQVVVEDEDDLEEFDQESLLEELRSLRKETNELLSRAKRLGVMYLISELAERLKLLDGWEKEIKDSSYNDDREGEY